MGSIITLLSHLFNILHLHLQSDCERDTCSHSKTGLEMGTNDRNARKRWRGTGVAAVNYLSLSMPSLACFGLSTF